MDNKVKECLTFVRNLRREQIAPNQAAILMYIHLNPEAEQVNMRVPLGMSANLISNAMQILLAKRFVIQTELKGVNSYRKTHKLSLRGEEMIKNLVR